MPKNRILVIGDLHLPAVRKGYLEFCQDLYEQWGCNRVVFIGDVIDHHAISFHAKHPQMPGPTDEYELALECVQEWYKAFPKANVCRGNHDDRIVRLAESVGIPETFLQPLNKLYQTPGWVWDWDFVIDDIYFFHGEGCSGIHPAFNAAKKMLLSTVMGHIHTAAGVKWLANPKRRIFSMDVSTGIDDRKMAFAYGKHAKQRSMLGAGVIVNGIPYYEPMPIGRGEKYWDGNFK